VSVHAPRRHFVLAYIFGKLRDAGMVLTVLVLLLGNTLLTAGLGVLQARGSRAVEAMPYIGFFVTSLGQALTQLLTFLLAVSPVLCGLQIRQHPASCLAGRVARLGITAGYFSRWPSASSAGTSASPLSTRFSVDANVGRR
jgi:hypothetical protein